MVSSDKFSFILTGLYLLVADEKLRFYYAVTDRERFSRITTAQLDGINHMKEDYGQDQHIVFVADLSCPNISVFFDKVNCKHSTVNTCVLLFLLPKMT